MGFSGVGLSIGWGVVLQWRTEPLEKAGAELKKVEDRLLNLQDELRDARPRRWSGVAAQGAQAELGQISEQLSDRTREIAAARRAVLEAADAVEGVVRGVQDVDAFAAAYGLSVDRAGRVTDYVGAEQSFSDAQAMAVYRADRQRIVDDCVARMDQVVRKAVEVDRDLCNTLQSQILRGTLVKINGETLGEAVETGFDKGDDGLFAPPSGPDGKGGTPAQNAGWWDSLSDQEQRQVIAEHPEWINNRDGVDFEARDLANRVLLPRYQWQLEADERRIRNEMSHLPYESAAFQHLAHELQTVQDKQTALAEVQEVAALDGRHILGLNIGEERAEAIIANGNVDTAEHVAVLTPGMNTKLQTLIEYPDGSDGNDTKMYDLRLKMKSELVVHGADPGTALDRVATVTWVGYQAPQSFPAAMQGEPAEEGSAALAQFYQGVTASRTDDPHLTALGHSYGSTVTGEALQRTTGVDDMALFGSPGMGTDHDKVMAPTDRSYFATADGDPVTKVTVHTERPSTGAGFTQWETDAATAPDGTPLSRVTGHTSYLQDGSTSQYNLAAVATGYPEDVIAHR